MDERSKKVFGNEINEIVYRNACRTKQRFILKYGDDTKQIYHLKAVNNKTIGKYFNVQNLVRSDKPLVLNNRSVIIGNIRMGYGHYRIAMAIASCAHSLGYTPYWLDLNSFEDTTGGKVINYLNKLYSLGSRLSQRIPLFDKLLWEPGSKNMYKKLSRNAIDQKSSELMTRAYQDFNKNTPFIATHSWPAQAAVHAKMECVVNVVPDNLPISLHLAEGSVHTVQTPSSYFGYKTLNEMYDGEIKHVMSKDDIVLAGHYVDHEIVSNITKDCNRRIQRITDNKPVRYLIPIGGAGAGLEMIEKIIIHLLPHILNKTATIFLNLGDHIDVLDRLNKKVPNFKNIATIHPNNFSKTEEFAEEARNNEDLTGLHVFYNSDIFAAVYSTNLLMREADILVTKPSELAFYPIPKLLTRRVGAHEAYGALRSSEIGDGTIECRTFKQATDMIDMLMTEKSNITDMCKNIIKANKIKIYDGGYEVVKTAIKLARKKK